jgi:hypothetical protein
VGIEARCLVAPSSKQKNLLTKHLLRQLRTTFPAAFAILASMKISGAFAVALLVGSASASKSAKVGVTCKNLDVNSLTPKALAYAAKAVEMTFNDVHNKETAHAVAVGSFAGDSSLRTKVS